MSTEPEIPEIDEFDGPAVPHGGKFRRLFRLLLTFLGCAVLGYGIYTLSESYSSADAEGEGVALTIHRVVREDFESFVSESGDIESASNVEIRCEVKSEGRAGTAILSIVEEGTRVKKDDLLLQFDDSVIKQLLTQLEIVVATDEKALIQAEAEFTKAEQTLEEYKDGLFLVEKETIEGELFQAQSQFKSAEDVLKHSEKMFRKGFVTQTQLEADTLARDMAERATKAAQTKLKVLEDFTLKKKLSEYEAEIKSQRATVKAAKYTLELSVQRRDEVAEQLKKCKVYAPSAGQVVYANNLNRSQKIIIEEGSIIREGQVVIRLPDPSAMQVKARVNDSKINLVKVKNPVSIELDVSPEAPVRGIVSKVNPFPYPRQWHGGPIEYGCEILILEPPAGLTPGQRAKIKIFVEEQKDVLTIPIQSVIEQSGSHYCLVRNSTGEWMTRKVEIGSNNGSFVIVKEGVTEGEEIAATVDLIWDDVQRRQSNGQETSQPYESEIAER
ncbi:MAG: hypothetical protein CMJ78_17580 [Planctomycetaceae bacterium]|nr:hypothetical protein [Planctomycetaceae bacterium]